MALLCVLCDSALNLLLGYRNRKIFTDDEVVQMKFGDKVKIKDGSQVDGCVGIVYRIETRRTFILLDREVLWPVEQHSLEPVDKDV